MSKEIDRINEGFNVHGDPYPFQMGERFALFMQSNGSNFLLNFYKKISTEMNKSNFVFWEINIPILIDICIAYQKCFQELNISLFLEEWMKLLIQLWLAINGVLRNQKTTA